MSPLLDDMNHHFILICVPAHLPDLKDGDVVYGWLLTLQKHHCALKNAFYVVSWAVEFLFGNQNHYTPIILQGVS